MTTETLLFSLLGAEACGNAVAEDACGSLSVEVLDDIYVISRKHDLAHIVGQALSRLGVLGADKVSQKFKETALQAVHRYVRMNHAYGQLCHAFESAHIPFIPLKGAVIRDFYPEPWMRTSCDIDILVREENLETVINLLVSNLGYRNEGRGYHDVSLFSPNNVHVELHFTLLDEARFPEAADIITDVWEQVIPVQEGSMQMQMPDELYYFYHILHMANHFYGGGCGIRPFLDLWILDYKVEHDTQKREALLQKGGMLTFALVARSLAGVWFSGQTHTELTRKMEAFILGGGVYGNMENMAAVQQAKKGGKIQFILYKIFMPYSLLKGHYPILQKHKYLLPFCQVARWFRLLSRNRWKRSLRELKTNAEISIEQVSSTADLLKVLGL